MNNLCLWRSAWQIDQRKKHFRTNLNRLIKCVSRLFQWKTGYMFKWSYYLKLLRPNGKILKKKNWKRHSTVWHWSDYLIFDDCTLPRIYPYCNLLENEGDHHIFHAITRMCAHILHFYSLMSSLLLFHLSGCYLLQKDSTRCHKDEKRRWKK